MRGQAINQPGNQSQPDNTCLHGKGDEVLASEAQEVNSRQQETE
jgi:hypothetical protein